MAYSYSHIDRKLIQWFKTDMSCKTLHGIELQGRLRSLKDVKIEIDYPITAIAGKNGCGKTTVLALAACAYHNMDKSFRIKAKGANYYTFSDFFIQTSEEVKPDGITILYKFFVPKWSSGASGFGKQAMRKRKGGKWSKYENRVKKNVIYLGIDRVVPQTEKQVFKSYLRNFKDGVDGGWYNEVQRYVGKILGKSYSNFKIKNAGAHKLQLVKETGITYSGFNMGAGEKALFELFSIIHECASTTKKVLIIIDEIELGLHEIAQRNLIEVLKEICEKHKMQFIFTTHSPAILDSLPPEGRFYIDKVGGESIITKGISGAFAAGRLADSNSHELDIYVEDEIALTLITSFFNIDLRQRIGVIPIGSYNAVCRQLGAAYKHQKLKSKSIAVLDGDQRNNLASLVTKMIQELELSTDAEKTKFREWVRGKILFLPGKGNPETWIIEKSIDCLDVNLSSQFGVSIKFLRQELTLALGQSTHEKFYYLSKKLSLDSQIVINILVRAVAVAEKGTIKKLRDDIELFLE